MMDNQRIRVPLIWNPPLKMRKTSSQFPGDDGKVRKMSESLFANQVKKRVMTMILEHRHRLLNNSGHPTACQCVQWKVGSLVLPIHDTPVTPPTVNKKIKPNAKRRGALSFKELPGK
jgi:hypothetical protein